MFCKSFTKLLFATLATAASMTSCINKNNAEQTLDGLWETAYTVIDEDGDECLTTEILDLNVKTHTFKQTVKESAKIEGKTMKLGSYEIHGTWKANNDEIEFRFNKSDIKLKYNIIALRLYGGRDAVIADIIEENAGVFTLNSYSDNEFSIPVKDSEDIIYHRKF